MTDRNGLAAEWRPSPNFGARAEGVATDLIILHYTDMATAGAAIDWLCDPVSQVSAHYVVAEDGRITQLVAETDRAWHAGVSSWRGRGNCNDDSVGIELEGLEGQPFDEPQYETLASLCAAIAQHYPIAHIAGHEHIAPGRKQDPGAGFDWRLLREQLGWSPQMFPAQVVQR